jgi:predicted transcriptional regulator
MTTVEKHIRLSTELADRLSRLARTHGLREDQVVEKALDILFSLTDLLDQRTERRGWSFLSEDSLQRIWDNEEDAVYDK